MKKTELSIASGILLGLLAMGAIAARPIKDLVLQGNMDAAGGVITGLGTSTNLTSAATLGQVQTNITTAATNYANAAQGAKADSALQPAGNGSALTGLTKSQIGLGNADNTSDANKPISNATQTALDLKSDRGTTSVTANTDKLALTGIQAGQLVLVTGERNRLDRFMGAIDARQWVVGGGSPSGILGAHALTAFVQVADVNGRPGFNGVPASTNKITWSGTAWEVVSNTTFVTFTSTDNVATPDLVTTWAADELWGGGTLTVNNLAQTAIEGNWKTVQAIFPDAQAFTPTTGTTLTIAQYRLPILVALSPAGTLASLTITLPPLPYAGQQISISTTQALTSLTINGGTVIGNITTLAANGFVGFVFDGASWRRVQ